MIKKLSISLAVIIVAVLIWLFAPGKPEEYKSTSIKIKNTVLTAEIADTPALMQQGLSGRESLAYDKSMLFIFETPSKPGFWMKDMYFALDIIWIGEDQRVREITKNIMPGSYPQILSPSQPVLYVLEANAGWSEKNNIQIGDMVEFEKR